VFVHILSSLQSCPCRRARSLTTAWPGATALTTDGVERVSANFSPAEVREKLLMCTPASALIESSVRIALKEREKAAQASGVFIEFEFINPPGQGSFSL
jgi:hypothetical protein